MSHLAGLSLVNLRYATDKQLTLTLQRRIRRHLTYTFNSITVSLPSETTILANFRLIPDFVDAHLPITLQVFREKSVMQFLPDHVRWKLIFFTRSRAFDTLSISKQLDVRLVMTIAQSMRPMHVVSQGSLPPRFCTCSKLQHFKSVLFWFVVHFLSSTSTTQMLTLEPHRRGLQA